MSILKNSLRLILLFQIMSIGACKTKAHQTDPATEQLNNMQAYKNINDSISRFPDNDTLYLRRALRLTQENAHELAYTDFKKAWTIRSSLNIGLPYAANLEILGRRNEKLILLKNLSQRFPDNPQVGRLMAESYSSSGDLYQAMNIYNSLIEKDSLNPEPYYEKAMLQEQLKDTSGAIQSLKKAYALQGIDTYGLELAILYAEQKNPQALAICDYILKKDSAHLQIDPLFIKGIYFANIKSYNKAIVQFDSCIARDWKTTDAYLEKGRAFFQMKNFTAAEQTFAMAITVTNTDPDAYFWLGRAYEAQHQDSNALSLYRKALALDRNFTEARERIAILERGFVHPSH